MAYHTPYASQALSLKLTDHRALIFDVYGTLVDWESAIHDVLGSVFPGSAREQILADYAAVEANLQTRFQRTSYSQILEMAYRQLTAPSASGVTPTSGIALGQFSHQHGDSMSSSAPLPIPENADDEAKRFGRSIPQWKPFPDTVEALHRLKKHFALVVLSNVDDASFAGTHATLCTPAYPGSALPTVTPDSPFSLVLTAQQVGVYKPDPLMLASALRELSANPSLRVDPSAVLVVANSTRHDIIPGRQHGLRSVWISRHGRNIIGNEGTAAYALEPEGLAVRGEFPFTWRYETLGAMADAVEEESKV